MRENSCNLSQYKSQNLQQNDMGYATMKRYVKAKLVGSQQRNKK